MTESTTPQLTESEVEAIEARMNKTPEGPWFAAADAAKECGPHRDSGLALVDTGRESDWPIARLCEWHKAQFIAHSREDVAALIRDWRALQAEIADYEQTDLVPRTRYNAADAAAREARGMVETTADKAKVEIERLESENAALREQLAQKNHEVQSRLDDIDSLRSRLAAAQNELTELRKFKQDMSGEFLGI